ncbi:hypothetical protein [Thorsellia anophelis]|uniref:Uncharacterized protein n=1 Tax=Thorsellia anophelis DSM 18579 TaxID=1123402 RepID=A0A1I0FI49_9GAMM|nr:hypothetical protein [Thorsellia anophelis]SET57900.1 hypothetical protein SAMN02583745_02777 [Thorsellia anophelis DSM 18579]
MKNTFFKRTAIAIALSSSFFAMTANAALVQFDSAPTNQIHGFVPIFPAMGAAITKKDEPTVPYAASANGNAKTKVEVGDTLYVPVNIANEIRTANEEALGNKIYRYADLDGDAENSTEIALSVEWFSVAKGSTTLAGGKSLGKGIQTGEFGVPYTVQMSDAGRQIGFRVTPISALGLPLEGYAIEVPNVALLAGQAYPEITDPSNPGTDTDGDGKPDEPGTVDPSQPPVVIVPVDPENPGGTDPENPNIGGGGIVDSGYPKYQVVIVNSNNEAMSGTGAKVAYVNSQYRAKILKIDQDPTTGEIALTNGEVTYSELDEAATSKLSNNIVWQLSNEDGMVVSTGLSEAAFSTDVEGLTALLADKALDPMYKEGADITGRLTGENTLVFKTQLNNEDALHVGAPNNSEQGLTIKAILVADDELEFPDAPVAPVDAN